MNTLMQEGGIADDGMNVDPISGNEIPPGSMAEEVRDDIPAQLSGGEYVVPADVLRYYGVAFFEQLRAKAKRGLAEMEAGGRIGGEPVPMRNGMEMEDEEDDLDDEDEMMLNEVMGMAQGGMMTSQPQQANNYYGLQPTMKIDRQTVSAFQEGGMAVDVNNPAASAQQFTSSFDPTKYGLGFMLQQTEQPPATGTAAPVEMRTYVNAQGEIRMIPFQNGAALEPIPEGFYPQGQVPAQTQVQQRDDSGDDDQKQEPTKSYTEYTVEDWNKYNTDRKAGGTFGQIVGGFIGGAVAGPFGAVAGKNLAAEAIARDGINAYNALNEFVGGMSKNDPNYASLSAKRDEMYGALTAAQEEDPGFFGKIINSIFGKSEIAKPKGGSGGGRAAGGGTTTAEGGGSSDDDGAAAVVTRGGAASAPAVTGRGTGATATAGRAVSPTTGQGITSRGTTALEGPEAGPVTRVAQDQKLGAGARGAAKGGLMQKPKSKNPTQKRKIKTTDA